MQSRCIRHRNADRSGCNDQLITSRLNVRTDDADPIIHARSTRLTETHTRRFPKRRPEYLVRIRDRLHGWINAKGSRSIEFELTGSKFEISRERNDGRRLRLSYGTLQNKYKRKETDR